MRVLVEHPIFTPFTGDIHGGTELFVYRLKEGLRLRGHEVEIFAPADSTKPCIRSGTFSTRYNAAAGKLTQAKNYYLDLKQESAAFDAVLLNTSLYCPALLDPAFSDWFGKCTYFNHNASNWFTAGFAGRQMQVILRYYRSFGGRSYYLDERNRAVLDAAWANPAKRSRALTGKTEAGLRRIGNQNFLSHAAFDGWFNQAVAVQAAPREAEGFLIAIGRPDKEKRLVTAAELARKLGRELVVFTMSQVSNVDAGAAQAIITRLREWGAIVVLDAAHHEIMDALSRADCLLLPSVNETFSIVAFEAMCHGVSVSCLDAPPALELYPALAREWGDVTPTSLQERTEVSRFLLETYSMSAFGERLEAAITYRGTSCA